MVDSEQTIAQFRTLYILDITRGFIVSLTIFTRDIFHFPINVVNNVIFVDIFVDLGPQEIHIRHVLASQLHKPSSQENEKFYFLQLSHAIANGEILAMHNRLCALSHRLEMGTHFDIFDSFRRLPYLDESFTNTPQHKAH
ncbi:hypothetical protein PsorP6_000082 [Peronosclerospora sorghi]|uniref:Uncharacterized protein n=1 Tax=Peronosclerospora sorghi TaxID=230839 RepID=A0ACC0WT61_9STRA|nr:hypothetical protein PsorP6_000082 [Peronosclerospora sorghi]